MDRLFLKPMGDGSPKAQIAGATLHILVNALRSRRGDRSTSALPSNKLEHLLTPGLSGGDFGEIGRELIGGKVLNVHFD